MYANMEHKYINGTDTHSEFLPWGGGGIFSEGVGNRNVNPLLSGSANPSPSGVANPYSNSTADAIL